MSPGMVLVAIIFLVLFAGVLAFNIRRTVGGHRPSLRRIQAFDAIKQYSSQVVEAGKPLHISVGTAGVASENTADTLAGLAVLTYLAEQSAATGEPPTISMADPMVLFYVQETIRKAHTDFPEIADDAYRNVRWIAPQPAAYAAGVMNILDMDEVEANIMVGQFGDEYLLIGETSARRGMAHVGGTSDPNTLPFIFATADNTLFGEEIYAAGAYLNEKPSHIGSLLTEDFMRWLLFIGIVGGIIAASMGVSLP